MREAGGQSEVRKGPRARNAGGIQQWKKLRSLQRKYSFGDTWLVDFCPSDCKRINPRVMCITTLQSEANAGYCVLFGFSKNQRCCPRKKCDLFHGLIMFKTQCRCSGLKRVSCMVPWPLPGIEAGRLYNQRWKLSLIITRIKLDQSNFIALHSHSNGH